MSEPTSSDPRAEAGDHKESAQASSSEAKTKRRWRLRLSVFGEQGTASAVRWVIGIVLALLVVLLLNWAGAQETKRVLMEEKSRGVNALSVVLRPEFIRPNPDRLSRIAIDLVQSGVYEVVVFADADGRVITTTDQVYRNRTLPIRESHFAGMFTATVRFRGDRIIADRGVYVAGNRVEGNTRIGWILVKNAEQ